jgi:FMN phosphatase YigB (HAD superfamily)
VRHRVLVTDLDNTLYDWVTYFATAFSAMADAVYELTGIPKDRLFGEFKRVHRRYANSEQPFAVLELPSIRRHFGTSDRAELRELLDPALYAFNKMRKETLRLYDTVAALRYSLRDYSNTAR